MMILPQRMNATHANSLISLIPLAADATSTLLGRPAAGLRSISKMHGRDISVGGRLHSKGLNVSLSSLRSLRLLSHSFSA